MTKRDGKRRMTVALCSTLIAMILAWLLVHQFTGRSRTFTSTDANSAVDADRPDEDLSPEEAGRFAGPSYRSARLQHVTNRSHYRALQYQDVASDASFAMLRSTIAKSFDQQRNSRAGEIGGDVPATVVDKLSDHLKLVLDRARGRSWKEYATLSGTDAQVKLPVNDLPTIKEVFEDLTAQTIEMSPQSSPQEITAAAERMAAASDDFDSGNRLITGFSVDTNGLAVALKWVTDASADTDLLELQIPERDLAYWYGSLAQSAILFVQPPEPWKTVLSRNGRVLRAHVIIIVRAKDNELHPLHLSLWYDEQRSTWWLDQASRRSSIRVGNAPPLVL